MRHVIVVLIFISVSYATYANVAVASAEYVQKSVENRVDTSATANQTMAGSYTVSGSLKVPTPPLPPAL